MSRTPQWLALLAAATLLAGCSSDKADTTENADTVNVDVEIAAEADELEEENAAAAEPLETAGPETFTPETAPKLTAAPTELIAIDTQLGLGELAKAGNQVQVHYSGWLFDPAAPDYKGTPFDSSVERGRPFGFPLGGGRVIRGWDEGVEGMREGGKRTLLIPSEMAYGARAVGGVIPANSSLVFDVQMLDAN